MKQAHLKQNLFSTLSFLSLGTFQKSFHSSSEDIYWAALCKFDSRIPHPFPVPLHTHPLPPTKAYQPIAESIPLSAVAASKYIQSSSIKHF